MLVGTPLARLQRCVDASCVEVLTDTTELLVVEKEKEGEAEVRCRHPSVATWLRLRPGDTRFFQLLREQKSADGVLLLLLPDGACELHLIECKKTVNEDAWRKAKEQFAWSCLRAQILCHLMGVAPSRVVCHTAFRFERLSVARSSNPGLHKLPLGSGGAGLTPEMDALFQRGDWEEPQITLHGFAAPVEHRRISLDQQTGQGQTQLNG